MRDRLPALLLSSAAALAAAALPLGAQQPLALAAGDVREGRLVASDPVLSDGAHYHTYHYRGSPGERIVITLRSTEFDAYLFGGRVAGDVFTPEAQDDDSGGGTDARLDVRTLEDGSYVIRASSYAGGETGAYTLTVTPAMAPREEVAPVEIRIGEPVRGALEPSDPLLEDGSHYDLYIYRGVSAEPLVITLRSEAFDAFLYGGRFDGGTFVAEDMDDDGAGGTDARLVVRAGADGTYVIRANSFDRGETGAYTLTIERP